MQPPPLPLTRDLVLIGGGHTHALVLRKWGMDPLPGVRVTLINPGPTAPYSGMLPGHVAGHYDRDALDIDLVRLARFAGARLILGAAAGIDRANRLIHVPGRPPVGYDVGSIDIGITSDMPALPGFADHAVPAKPLGPFAARWGDYLSGAGPASVAVIGGGVAGAELSMAMAHALAGAGRPAQVHLIDAQQVLGTLRAPARLRLLDALMAQNVTLHEQAEITGISAAGVTLANGRLIEARFVTGAAGARPYEWLSQTGLALHQGFVTVDNRLRSSDPNIFAVGDCAHLSFDPRPKAGVYAVRQAPVLYDNLRGTLAGTGLRPYRPQRDYLKLISLGGKAALGDRFGLAFSGPWVWRWKDRIDQRFMDRFRDLPHMTPPALPWPRAHGLREAMGPKPMCGGCGSKVGRGTLNAVLHRTTPHGRSDITPLPGDDAALLQTGGARQVISTDHLRALTDDPVVMTRIAAQHALNDIWAMGANPQAATATLILPRLSDALTRRTMDEIMTTASEAMAEAGAAIVGGHSSVGSELTIGFTITGLLDAPPITLAGARPGDKLILTRPVGTGVIMAAEMTGAAPGDWVAGALAQMCRSNRTAAGLLRHASAMTDVTGFGLAGHLQGMCEASRVGALLRPETVPLLPGALRLAERGIRSSLFPQNRAALPGWLDTALCDLMLDPQTSGGLLAAVAPDRADATLAALRDAGEPAAIVGEITANAGQIALD
ncbi:selenide, water dikinase SelD [Aestuariicoccus sp. MJ-SS9]|uniref:selenide, water dikinase SelD n=1 Tax=Aestuariicoccus sp. MJ-SS9 TaxID=3079855 RepID=UPI002907AEAA|nr:selenide, water dikinase SelD [Aestuariicoccus sp. MJ-SS9]MDU8912404.1 selenide, water dikinase SelD [Aestuariicoccus sp. MJ-SS9]